MRQITHQLEELGISPSSGTSGASRTTPKPRLETLESGHEFDGGLPSSFSAGEQYEGLATREVPITIAPSAHKYGSHDPPVLKHHPPSSRHHQVSDTSLTAKTASESTMEVPSVQLANNGGNETAAADEDIHRHGVGAIDNASKYLQKHHLDHSNKVLPDAEVHSRLSPRAGMATVSITIPKKSPRTTNLSSTDASKDILMSTSACPSPHPIIHMDGAVDVFPQRSISEGVSLLTRVESTHASQTSLPPIGRPDSASSQASLLSAKKFSPRPEPRSQWESSTEETTDASAVESQGETVTEAIVVLQASGKEQEQDVINEVLLQDDNDKHSASPLPPSPLSIDQMEVDEVSTRPPQKEVLEDSVLILEENSVAHMDKETVVEEEKLLIGDNNGGEAVLGNMDDIFKEELGEEAQSNME